MKYFTIQYIKDSRKHPQTEQLQYLVHWKGFDSDQDQWIPFNKFQFKDQINIKDKYLKSNQEVKAKQIRKFIKKFNKVKQKKPINRKKKTQQNRPINLQKTAQNLSNSKQKINKFSSNKNFLNQFLNNKFLNNQNIASRRKLSKKQQQSQEYKQNALKFISYFDSSQNQQNSLQDSLQHLDFCSNQLNLYQIGYAQKQKGYAQKQKGYAEKQKSYTQKQRFEDEKLFVKKKDKQLFFQKMTNKFGNFYQMNKYRSNQEQKKQLYYQNQEKDSQQQQFMNQFQLSNSKRNSIFEQQQLTQRQEQETIQQLITSKQLKKKSKQLRRKSQKLLTFANQIQSSAIQLTSELSELSHRLKIFFDNHQEFKDFNKEICTVKIQKASQIVHKTQSISILR